MSKRQTCNCFWRLILKGRAKMLGRNRDDCRSVAVPHVQQTQQRRCNGGPYWTVIKRLNIGKKSATPSYRQAIKVDAGWRTVLRAPNRNGAVLKLAGAIQTMFFVVSGLINVLEQRVFSAGFFGQAKPLARSGIMFDAGPHDDPEAMPRLQK